MLPAAFDPLVRLWFARRFAQPTEPQALGWPEIQAGRNVLISAPTGSGKTLAAFLISIDALLKRAREGALEDRIEVVYVSPLKALSNDVHRNLEVPLAEISGMAREQGIALAPIRAALRTGDTTAWEREQALRRPPHILVTTPESLFILTTTEKGRRALATARTLIVDEIHAVVDDKRGSHLALTIARLEALAGARLQRIGLSATVKPIEAVAEYLGGTASQAAAGFSRLPTVIDIGRRRVMDLAVEAPRDELGPVASNEMWSEIYDRIAELIAQHRTTLVFVNTRRLAERVSHHLSNRLGEEAVLPHHGSLSRKLRLRAEERLKKGELRAVVATASLELGIDIGSVDLVCQVGSPRSIGVALQRIGRSGHWVGATPKGRLFATTRDELVECAALVRAIRQGEIDALEIPEAPLDILAQQIAAETACREWREDELFELVRSTYPYRNLARADFDAIVDMLSEGITGVRGRAGALVHRDRVNHVLRGRRGARLAAITSGGAIPDNANYQVLAEPEGTVVGTVDEDFAVESLAGDVFLLGTNSWRIRRIEPGRVRVEDAHGEAPNIPFWRGEAPGRTTELSAAVSRVREEIAGRSPEAALVWLREECGLDERGALQAVDYVRAGAAALGALPTVERVVAERFFDEAGGMQLVLHAPFGSRINRAWGLALRKRFCRTFNFELQAAATDNGIVISLAEQHSFPLDIVFEFLKTETLRHVLTQAMLAAPMFTARWRWNASRALAVPRFTHGRKAPPQIQRMRSDDLLASVFPDQAACAENLEGEIRVPDHPLVAETIRNCLNEAMDLGGLERILDGIRSGAIRTVAIDTAEPSPFSHEILNANPYAYLDDAPLEERRARAVKLRRSLSPDLAGGPGALDEAAIAQVAAESWPVVRDPDELHDALVTLALLPPLEEWRGHFEALVAASRATTVDGWFWTSAERMALVRAVYSKARFEPAIDAIEPSRALPDTQEACAAELLRGWLESTGPLKASALAARLAMPQGLIDSALARLEAEGQILRGQFTAAKTGETEWCNRRLLARIHRLTLGRLRNEIEPAATADFIRFLARWQHVASGTQLHGAGGALEIIRQLQGYEIPAGAWEAEVLPRRVARYEPELLDRLCLSGQVMWGRLSPHPAFEAAPGARRVRPTRVAPVSLFLREDAGVFLMPLDGSALPALSHAGREVLEELRRRGASFFGDLERAVHRLPSEIEDALWELVAAGLVTADGFENLRSLIDEKRRRGEGRGRRARPRNAAGRWALLGPRAAAPDAELFARQLLSRWGIVFRDLLARETLAPPWRDLLVALRRMEARGEIRGGRFVAAFSGEQFARPEAVDLLRAVRRRSDDAAELAVSPADPLNLAGIVLPGPRVSALATGAVRLLSAQVT
jgi:ATP-dependent Lhr-like helicase